MIHPIVLESERLLLRAFDQQDAKALYKLANTKEIAATTLRIPHPYGFDDGVLWISSQRQSYDEQREIIFAITRKDDDTLLGSISLVPNQEFENAELGYWIGKPYWNKGYISEAAKLILAYGFNTMNLQRIHAHHMGQNPASGKVLQKIGMKYEGCLRQHIKKWGKFDDAVLYGILRSEYEPGDDI